MIVMRQWSVGEFLIYCVIVAACIGVLLVAVKQFGIAVPGWLVQIGWILLVAIVAVIAIRILLTL